ncbi:hypothetical protein J437_LFUL005704 [Ladona fulva]|uniref:Dynein light chain Tctex-type 1 n=1 Tax=Ladona fulva TaxID=123851 RepID=A0A8K0NYF9_LADFU|nr:hypothetical protein J437_LFUL005704 [Ladona fulva]
MKLGPSKRRSSAGLSVGAWVVGAAFVEMTVGEVDGTALVVEGVGTGVTGVVVVFSEEVVVSGVVVCSVVDVLGVGGSTVELGVVVGFTGVVVGFTGVVVVCVVLASFVGSDVLGESFVPLLGVGLGFVDNFTDWLIEEACGFDGTDPELASNAFRVDIVSNIIKEVIENTIGANTYQNSKVNQWTSTVVESCLSSLNKMQKPFKYVVTCTIMQKNGAGLHSASSCYWDDKSDGTCTVRWENKTMYCIVSVFGLAI